MKRIIFALIFFSFIIAFISCSRNKADESISEEYITMSDDGSADKIMRDDSYLRVATYQVEDKYNGRFMIFRTNSHTDNKDTIEVEGTFNQPIAYSDKIAFVYGVDTAWYDLDTISCKISPVHNIMLPGSIPIESGNTYKWKKNHTGPDYEVTVYIKPGLESQLTPMLVKALEKSIKEYMPASSAYSSPTSDMSLNQAINLIGHEFQRTSEHKFDYENYTWDNSFYSKYYPTWKSSDGRFVTYCISCKIYSGGAHGMEYMSYATFDLKAGKMLGIKDLFTRSGFESVDKMLSDMLSAERDGFSVQASLDSDRTFLSNHYQLYGNKIYPRPALTAHGVAFAYQPYDKGCYSEGVKFYLIPYSKLDGLLKIKIVE